MGEGGDDCNLRTDERGGYKTTKKHIHEIASKNLSSGNPLNSMKFASMMKRWAGLLPSPPTPPLTQFKYARTVYYTGSGGGREWPSQPLVPLPFPPGIYIIIYSVPTYAYTVYVYVYIMGLGGGGRGAGCNRRSRVRGGDTSANCTAN